MPRGVALAASLTLLVAAAAAPAARAGADAATADAAVEARIAAARDRALAAHKRLLIDLGADWCLGCRVLGTILRRPDVAAHVAQDYELVTVDVGRFDRNLAVPMRLGLRGRALYLPALIVVDPAAHRVVNRGREMDLAFAGRLTPHAVAAWLARWAR